MVTVKLVEISMLDRTFVFRFYDEKGLEIGVEHVVAGVDFENELFDRLLQNTTIAELTQLQEGFSLDRGDDWGKLATIAYNKLVNRQGSIIGGAL